MTRSGAEDEAVRRTAQEAERRRRRAKVFGDVLPDQTADDRDESGSAREQASEEWLQGQVPPHHG